MKRKLSVRFYAVKRLRKTDPLLASVLDEIYKKPLGDRKVDCDGMRFRLERLNKSNSKVFGELNRIQEDDYPSEITDDGAKPLGVNSDLGHGVVFCFDPTRHLIAIPWDPNLRSMVKFEAYLSNAHPGAAFHFEPRMKKDAWLEFEQHPIKRFSVSLAGFEGLSGLEGDKQSAFEGLTRFGSGYNSHTLKLTLSRGHKGGSLMEGIKSIASELLAKADVRGMSAKTDVKGDGEINLIDQVLSESVEVDFPRNDPIERYARLSKVLELAMIKNKDNL